MTINMLQPFASSSINISVVTGVSFCFSLIFPGVRLSSDAQFSDFLDGLGPAQLVGRQTLATPPMGENKNPFIQYIHGTW